MLKEDKSEQKDFQRNNMRTQQTANNKTDRPWIYDPDRRHSGNTRSRERTASRSDDCQC